MTTTIMRNSIIGDQWIRDACAANPTAVLPGEGNMITTGPCRLAFTDTLFNARTPSGNSQGTPKYGVMALYTPFTDWNVFYAEYYRVLSKDMPEYYVPEVQGYPNLEMPFHDQSKKLQYAGFTPGLKYINHTSKFKPKIVDSSPAKNPITDPSRVYPGVWALLVVNAYTYGKNPPQPKKGCAFGLQAVMILENDQPLAGGGVDPSVVFAGAKVKPPAINPAGLVGLAPGMPPVGMPIPPMSSMGAPPQMPPPPVGRPAVDDISSLF
jgi:hypothetical protein